MRKETSPIAGILWVSALAAALVAGASMVLSRHVVRVAEKPPGNRVDDAFRETVRRIDALEAMWQSALNAEAQRMLETTNREIEPTVVGVVQCSWLNPGFSDPSRAHWRLDSRDPMVKPVLDRFAKGEPSEWVFVTSEVTHGSDWIEVPGNPLAWRQGNEKAAVVLLLNPSAAIKIVKQDLSRHVESNLPEDEPGALTWSDPGGSMFIVNGKPSPDAKPDEILRHVSRFGDWTLRRYYPMTVTTHYKLPVLLGGFTLAALLLAGGAAIASWQRKATRLAEQRVSFVNRVSHELRTPLTNLLLHTDLALDGLAADDGIARRRLGLIREETARLSRIVDNVQTFARMEKGKSHSHAATCDVTKVITELREIFAPLFERKAITCDYDCDIRSPIPLDGDAFSQIVSNLLSNVEKYAGEGSRAQLRVFIEDGHLIAEVEDNGPGIPAAFRQRVFRAFERVGSRVDEGATGTGLGLTISRDLASQMGGSLELLDAARFQLTIPLERTSA